MVTAVMQFKDASSLEEGYGKPRDIILLTKVHTVNAIVFPVVVYGCESWIIKKAERWRIDVWIVVLEKTLKSPLDCKEMKPISPKGNQPWLFIGRTDAAAEAPVFWPPDEKSQLTGKDPDAGEDGEQKEKRGSRGWDGWMPSLIQWTWVGGNSVR